MVVELKDMDVGYGREEWGAVYDTKYFVIKLGKIISKNF